VLPLAEPPLSSARSCAETAKLARSVAAKQSRRARRHPVADDAMIDLLYRQPLQEIDFAEEYWRKCGIGARSPIRLR
jgi:hypothetical protein